MASTGEQLTGAWLRMIAQCDFVQYNVPLRGRQGEIDVIGLDLATETAYICEVATHLRGLQYTKGARPDNVNRISKKFQSDVDYAREYLDDFQHRFMLWSPVVRVPVADDTKYNQMRDIRDIRRNLLESHGVEVDMVINEVYLKYVDQMRELAALETAASAFPAFRVMQIIEQTREHVERLRSRGVDSRILLE